MARASSIEPAEGLSPPGNSWPRLALTVLAVALAMLLSPLRGHIDDTDAQLYQVLARQMAASHSWLEPGRAPGSLVPFREHLPFGFWPLVAVVRLLGEGALFLPGLVFSLGTVLAVLVLGARLVSVRAGTAAALLLACTETFFMYGARARLDPQLILFALLAAAPALLGRLRGRGAATAIAAGAVAALIKGPFGLVPLAAAGAARALLEAFPIPHPRGFAGRILLRELSIAIACVLTALLPAVVFLLADKASAGTWWTGYVHGQLLASAEGLRHDGATDLLFPFSSIVGRFWPGLPLVLLGLAQALPLPASLPDWLRGSARSRGAARLLALTSLFALIALCLPVRKVWNHEQVIYPLLALLAGAAIDGLLGRLSRRAAQAIFAAIGVLACAFAVSGLGARILVPRCTGSLEFKEQLDALKPPDAFLLVSSPTDWGTLASLAAEHPRSRPWPVAALPPGPALIGPRTEPGTDGRFARLAMRESTAQPPAPWHIIQAARGWQLLGR